MWIEEAGCRYKVIRYNIQKLSVWKRTRTNSCLGQIQQSCRGLGVNAWVSERLARVQACSAEPDERYEAKVIALRSL